MVGKGLAAKQGNAKAVRALMGAPRISTRDCYVCGDTHKSAFELAIDARAQDDVIRALIELDANPNPSEYDAYKLYAWKHKQHASAVLLSTASVVCDVGKARSELIMLKQQRPDHEVGSTSSILYFHWCVSKFCFDVLFFFWLLLI